MNRNAVGFPPPQQVGDTHTIGDVIWEWDGTAWIQQGSSGNSTGGGGVEEAPNDGQMYARQYQAPWGMGWTPFTPGSGGSGGIQDGDTVGQVTTWSGTEWTPDSSFKVDASYAYYIAASGDAGMIVQARSANELVAQTRYHSKSSGGANNGGSIGHNGDKLVISGQPSITGGEHLTIDATGNATFNVSASGAKAKFSCPVSALAPMLSLSRAGAGTISNDSIHVFATDGDKLKVDWSGNAKFNGTVDAAGFTINGVPIGGGGGDLYADRGSNQGAVYFGTPSSQYLYFNGSSFEFAGGQVSATDFVASSDERLKDNITTAPVGLIDSLKGREWDWSESGEKGSGVVAQELEQVLPHLVHTDDEGMKSVSYNGLVAYLIEEVKALKAEVEALK